MKLSACYIVKNEAKLLGKSLKSIEKNVDEIIVVDTGSTDLSATVARQCGAKVYTYPWIGDFAAARNFALDKVTGEWVVFLDADEYFARETASNLKASIESRAKNAELLLIKIFNVDADQNDKIIDSFFAPRIFACKPEIRYNGKIHEQLKKCEEMITATAVVPETELCLYHTGYSTSQIQQKAQRNLQMLLREMNDTTVEPQKLYVHLAEAYDGIGDTLNAMHYAKLDIASGRRNITYASRSYRLYLRLLEQEEQPDETEILRVLKKAIEVFPELAEFRAEHAQYLAAKFDYDAAIVEMQQALLCRKNYQSMEPTLFDEAAQSLAIELIEIWRKNKNFQAEIKVSACVITRNEASDIGRWIANMKLCSDEQILVDTGSTDDTVAIAQKAGIAVYHYPWINDFSAAKNFAIEKATGEWILFLDADEIFTLETVANVRKIIAREHLRQQEVDAILCPIINVDEDQNNREINRFVNLRLFRNVSYLRYEGTVHESLRHHGSALKIFVEKKDLIIHHTGYSSGRIKDKLQRNFELLQAEIKENGEKPQHYRYLMEYYQSAGDHEQVVKYGKMHLAANVCSVSNESDVYRNLINAMVALQEKPEAVAPYIEKALANFPDIPDFYAYYGANFFQQGDFFMAKKYLLEALQLHQHGVADIVISSSFAYILSETYSYLGEIFLREKDELKAQYYIDLALQDNPYNKKAFLQCCHLMGKRSVTTIDEMLVKYYADDKVSLSFVVQCLEEIAVDEVYFHYADCLEEKFGVVSLRTKWHRLRREGKNHDVYQQTLQQSTAKLQLLACSLLSMGREQQPKDLGMIFSPVLLHCLQRQQNMLDKMQEADAEGYITLLPVMIQNASPEVLQRFLEMAQDFSVKTVVAILRILFKKQCWLGILSLEEYCQSNEPEEGLCSEILRMTGIAAYYAGDFFKAKACLRQMSPKDRDQEIVTYLQWIRERSIP
jgi:Glycosyltransferases involved in cell wall biogenesis